MTREASKEIKFAPSSDGAENVAAAHGLGSMLVLEAPTLGCKAPRGAWGPGPPGARDNSWAIPAGIVRSYSSRDPKAFTQSIVNIFLENPISFKDPARDRVED